MTTLALTGSTGTVGGHTARLLAADGVPLRLLVRDPDRAPDLQGAEVVRAAYGDAACEAALRGVDTVFMVSAHESEDRVAVQRSFVAAAVGAGVRHIVYTSFVGASDRSTFLLGRDHAATEQAIRDSGLAWTFLRDNLYAEALPDLADADGVIRGPAGPGRVAPVSQRDVAAVAATVLGDPPSHRRRTYDLTGPEASTLHEVAGVLTRVLGRSHRFVDETVEEARASRARFDAPDWMVEAWVSTYTAIGDGELGDVSDDVPRLLGRSALTLAQALTATR